MEIIVGKYSGFCNGVRYTVEEANKALVEEKEINCLGEIVHNERVIEDLEKKGMKTINCIDDAKNNSTIIIRAHGERLETYQKIKEKNIKLLDLTCAKIKAIRKKIERVQDTHFIIIIGKKNHPETLGVQSFAGNDSEIIEEENEIKEFLSKYKNTSKNKIYIVSQTTFNSDKFDYLVEKIKEVVKDENIVDKTICDATEKRQEETRNLSKKVDCMIIVGGKKSSNTKELEVIAKENCKEVYLVQDKNDLKEIPFKKQDKIGIMAGASTPEIVVEEIIEELKSR